MFFKKYKKRSKAKVEYCSLSKESHLSYFLMANKKLFDQAIGKIPK